VLIHLARLGSPDTIDLAVTAMELLAEADRVGRHRLSEDPGAADLIVFPQCHMLPKDWRLSQIRRHALTEQFREKVMVYDERDRPWCAFPGVYVSMPASNFDDRYQRAWSYAHVPEVDTPGDPDLLFSFIGSPSSRCRRPLFALRHPDAVVEEVRRFTFYDPSSQDFDARRERFREILSRSQFVLCPRGRGTSSFRLYEALASARVPVIISDDWVPPAGPDWDRFSIRWPEGRIEGLVQVLEELAPDWTAMSSAARVAFRDFFARDVAFDRMSELYRDLALAQANALPSGGVRGRAFVAAGADVARWSASSAIRRTLRRILRRSRAATSLSRPAR
jgi:hypothetical protein